MKIYFAGSIRGGRDDAEIYHELIGGLATYGEVLTEHIGGNELSAAGEIELQDDTIHDRDMHWLLSSDVIVAEVTNPSVGVGYELGRAVERGKRIIALSRPSPGKALSAMIQGSQGIQAINYQSIEEALMALDKLIGKEALEEALAKMTAAITKLLTSYGSLHAKYSFITQEGEGALESWQQDEALDIITEASGYLVKCLTVAKETSKTTLEGHDELLRKASDYLTRQKHESRGADASKCPALPSPSPITLRDEQPHFGILIERCQERIQYANSCVHTVFPDLSRQLEALSTG